MKDRVQHYYLYLSIYCFFEYTVPIATSFLLELIYAGLSLCLPTRKRRALELLGEEKEGLWVRARVSNVDLVTISILAEIRKGEGFLTDGESPVSLAGILWLAVKGWNVFNNVLFFLILVCVFMPTWHYTVHPKRFKIMWWGWVGLSSPDDDLEREHARSLKNAYWETAKSTAAKYFQVLQSAI